LFLRADGRLGSDEGPAGQRRYDFLPPAVRRMPSSGPPPLPGVLTWETAPAASPWAVVGPVGVDLSAETTTDDVDWIVKLQLVGADGTVRDLTEGWLRGSHRALDEGRSAPGRPYHPHDHAEPVTPGKVTEYAIGLVPTAQRVPPGARIRLLVTSSDVEKGMAMAGMSHLPLAVASRQSVLSSSRLLLPVTEGEPPG
jgi:hypothetical protein